MNEAKQSPVNVYAETAVVQLLSDIFLGVAYFDVDTMQKNVSLACAGSTPADLRSIKVEVANYLLSNFGVMFMGLIINEDFRDTFVEAVSIEIALDNKDPEFVKNIRKSMASNFNKPSKGNFVINLEGFNESVYKKVTAKLSDSFRRVENYSDAMDILINDLNDRAMLDIGFCFSNFMYLIRAFAKDDVFFNYTRKVIRSVKDTLNL